MRVVFAGRACVFTQGYQPHAGPGLIAGGEAGGEGLVRRKKDETTPSSHCGGREGRGGEGKGGRAYGLTDTPGDWAGGVLSGAEGWDRAGHAPEGLMMDGWQEGWGFQAGGTGRAGLRC